RPRTGRERVRDCIRRPERGSHEREESGEPFSETGCPARADQYRDRRPRDGEQTRVERIEEDPLTAPEHDGEGKGQRKNRGDRQRSRESRVPIHPARRHDERDDEERLPVLKEEVLEGKPPPGEQLQRSERERKEEERDPGRVQRTVPFSSRKIEKDRGEQRGTDRVQELTQEKDVHVLLSRVETCRPPVNGRAVGPRRATLSQDPCKPSRKRLRTSRKSFPSRSRSWASSSKARRSSARSRGSTGRSTAKESIGSGRSV